MFDLGLALTAHRYREQLWDRTVPWWRYEVDRVRRGRVEGGHGTPGTRRGRTSSDS